MIQLPVESENVTDADKPREFFKYTGKSTDIVGHWNHPSRFLIKIAESKVTLIEDVQIFNFFL
jgi:hypothetical protein